MFAIDKAEAQISPLNTPKMVEFHIELRLQRQREGGRSLPQPNACEHFAFGGPADHARTYRWLNPVANGKLRILDAPESILSKRRDRLYRAKGSKDWIKVENQRHSGMEWVLQRSFR